MNEKTIQEIQEELKSTTLLKKEKEENLHQLQSEFSKIHEALETTIKELKSVKEKESALMVQLYNMQKDAIKEHISIDGIKKLLSKENPIFKKISEKGKEIKEVLDGTAFDKKWLDEQYEKYKAVCVQKGEEIKSMDEFKKIAITLKELKEENSDSQIKEIFTTAKSKIKKVGEKVQGTLASLEHLKEEVSEEQEKVSELPKTKKEALEYWVKIHNIQYSDDKIPELYEKYTIFLLQAYGQMSFGEMRYSDKGGAFKTALKKIFEI